jgi:hypothetical protein
MVKQDRPHETLQYCAQNMRFACKPTKARIQTHTHSRYLLLIDFTWQQ